MFQYGSDATCKETEVKEKGEELWLQMKVENYPLICFCFLFHKVWELALVVRRGQFDDGASKPRTQFWILRMVWEVGGGVCYDLSHE